MAKPATNRKFIIVGHDLRLGQVVTNLIENARSFVPETGGRITVRLARHRGSVRVLIEDNGPGIRAEVIERVFERFYTDRPDGEDFGQNSGLGLSISRQIIEAHGGTLTAENIPPDKWMENGLVLDSSLSCRRNSFERLVVSQWRDHACHGNRRGRNGDPFCRSVRRGQEQHGLHLSWSRYFSWLERGAGCR
jgi:signal transduction histidine kinase